MPKLYIGNKNYSSWSMRPWVLMKQVGIPFEEVMVRFDSFDAGSAFKTALQGDTSRELGIRTKAGIPVPLVDLRIVDPEMRDVAHDAKAAGEIVVRAPWLTQGYLHNPAASDELWEGGYLHTGDIGSIDPRGMLTVTDRLKDVIKTGGEWVSSLELESIKTGQDLFFWIIMDTNPKFTLKDVLGKKPASFFLHKFCDVMQP